MEGVEKLVVGGTYTYRQLCENFGEERKEGNSRSSQFKRWKQFFRWSKPHAQKYKIEEIYFEIRPVEDKRKDNGGNSTSKYSEIDDLIMDFLSESDEIVTTVARLGEQIGIFTGQYIKHRNDIKEFCNNNGYGQDFVSEYLDSIKSCVHRAIENSINRLAKAGFISSDHYCVLILKDNSTKKISHDTIKAYENEIENATGIKKHQLKNQIKQREFNQKVHSLIEETLGLAVKFYYREYHLRKLPVEYTTKTSRDVWRLTRKFILTIGCRMVNYICKLANQKYIEDPVSQTLYLVSEDLDSDNISDMFKAVVDLSNYFFAHMNSTAWNAYWENNELDDNGKDLVFISTLLWEKMPRYQKSISINNERGEAPEVYGRKQFVEELGLEDVQEIERILPDIDWERTWFDEEYTIRYANAFGEYYRVLDLFFYANEKYADEYAVYVARLAAEDRLNEQIHFFDFVHQLDESDTRYKMLHE